MTATQRDGIHRSEFARWLRQTPDLDSIRYGLSVLDVDWCIHRFMSNTDYIGTREIQNLMFIEEKSHYKAVGAAQNDTLTAIRQILARLEPRNLCRQCGGKVRRRTTADPGWPVEFIVHSPMARMEVTLRYWGFHLLQFSDSGPLDSHEIFWDKRAINRATLIQILRFDIRPTNLKPHDLRRHHGTKRQGRLF